MFHIFVTLIRSVPRITRLLVVLGILAVTTPIQGQVLSSQDDQTILTRLSLARYDVQELAIPDSLVSGFTISLNLDGEIVELELAPHSVRADGFRVRTRDATGKTHPYPLPAPTTYRGRIRQKAGSIAAASIINGQLRARIVDGDSVLVIQPLDEVLPKAGPNQYVLFHRLDEIALDYVCGTDLLPPRDQAVVGQKSFSGATGCDNITEIAFDSDVEYFLLNGSSVPATVADIESIVNAMNVIYERDVLITHTITRIIVQTAEPDLLDSTNAFTLLDEFGALWNSVHSPGSADPIARDIAHLMTGKILDGGVGGVAWVGQICADLFSGIGYALSQSLITTNFDFRVVITSHEVGHNWNALHCDGDADCAIMCSGLGGCAGITDQFGSTTIAVISSFRDSRPCLETLPPPVGPDCNINCIDDSVDISTGTSLDCNSNGIPDECDITSGLEGDCNLNGIPDSCEDCNGNGIADECDLSATFSQNSGALSPIGLGSDANFIFVAPPLRTSDVTFDFTASADLASTFISIEVFLNLVNIGEIFKFNATTCADPPDEEQIILTQSAFDSIVGSGDADVLMVASSSDPFACGGANFITVNMSYGSPSPFDTNNNGIIDSCECPADCAGSTPDGNVNVTDLLALLANWGGTPTLCDFAPPGGDGAVNVTDLLALLGAWGPCATP